MGRVLKRWLMLSLVSAVAGLGLRTTAWAWPTGICGVASDLGELGGCAACHNLRSPTTRLLILGLPGSDPTQPGYTPGETYDITVLVIGPPGVAAGFNLAPSQGTLATVPGDGSAYLCHTTECSVMQAQFFCLPGLAGNDCGVVVDPDCPSWDSSNSACIRCKTVTPGVCRPCDNVLDLAPPEATHSEPNPTKLWQLRWTAPPPNSGPVSFYLAGNSVVPNTTGKFAIWSQLGSDPTQPVIVVPEGEAPAASSAPALPLH